MAIAGDASRIEIPTLTDDQNALHTAKVKELLNMDKFGVVEETGIATRSIDTLGINTETGWIIQSETCGARI